MGGKNALPQQMVVGGEGGQQNTVTQNVHRLGMKATRHVAALYTTHPSHLYHHTHAHSMPRHTYFREHIFCLIPKVKRQYLPEHAPCMQPHPLVTSLAIKPAVHATAVNENQHWGNKERATTYSHRSIDLVTDNNDATESLT